MFAERVRVWASATVIWVCCGAAALAAGDPLKALPERTLGLVLVGRLADCDGKLIGLGQTLQLPVPSPLGLLKAQAGVTTGLDESGPAMLVAVGGEAEEERAALLYLPVKDYKAFIGQLKPQDAGDGLSRVELWKGAFLVRQVESYAVFAEPRHKEALLAADGTRAVPEELAPLREYLLANDIAAVVTRHGVRSFSAEAQHGLKEMEETLSGASKEMKAGLKVLQVYRKMFAAAERELIAVAAGAAATKDGALRASAKFVARAGGPLAAWLAERKSERIDPLEGLPAKPFLFAASSNVLLWSGKEKSGPQADIIEASLQMYGIQAADARRTLELYGQALKDVHSAGSAMIVLGNEPPIYRDIVGVVHTADADAWLDRYRTAAAAFNKIVSRAKDGLIALPPLQIEEVKVQDLPALQISMSLPKFAGTPQGIEPMLELVFGVGGKLVIQMAAVDKTRAVIAYQTKPDVLAGLIRDLRQNKPGLSADPQIRKTAALLPELALGKGYFSPAGAIAFANRFMAAMPFFGASPLPDFPTTPPIGAAMTVGPNELTAHLVVPVDTLKGIKSYALQMKTGQGGLEVKAKPPKKVALPTPKKVAKPITPKK